MSPAGKTAHPHSEQAHTALSAVPPPLPPPGAAGSGFSHSYLPTLVRRLFCASAPCFYFKEFWLFFSLSLWYFKLSLAVTGSLEVGENYSVFLFGRVITSHRPHWPSMQQAEPTGMGGGMEGGLGREGSHSSRVPQTPQGWCYKDQRFPLQQPTGQYSPSPGASRKASVLCILHILRAAISWCVCSLALLHSHSNLTLMRSILVAQAVKNMPIMQETRVRSLGGVDLLEKGLATQSSILP